MHYVYKAISILERMYSYKMNHYIENYTLITSKVIKIYYIRKLSYKLNLHWVYTVLVYSDLRQKFIVAGR